MATAIIITVSVLLLIVLIYLFFHYNNLEISLRKEAEAQENDISTVHDTMWKIIKEKAGVAEKYRDTFEKIYPELISGRYSNDGRNTMKWIEESNPDFDTSLYDSLMDSISTQRTIFQRAQKRMLDIVREHNTLIRRMPDRFFITDKSPIDYVPITSDKTYDVMQTRVDNEILEF